MTLKEFLLHKTKVGDLVWFTNGSWYLGCTSIDHEDLFIGSLNPELLKREVKTHHYETRDWITKPVLVVTI